MLVSEPGWGSQLNCGDTKIKFQVKEKIFCKIWKVTKDTGELIATNTAEWTQWPFAQLTQHV